MHLNVELICSFKYKLYFILWNTYPVIHIILIHYNTNYFKLDNIQTMVIKMVLLYMFFTMCQTLVLPQNNSLLLPERVVKKVLPSLLYDQTIRDSKLPSEIPSENVLKYNDYSKDDFKITTENSDSGTFTGFSIMTEAQLTENKVVNGVKQKRDDSIMNTENPIYEINSKNRNYEVSTFNNESESVARYDITTTEKSISFETTLKDGQIYENDDLKNNQTNKLLNTLLNAEINNAEYIKDRIAVNSGEEYYKSDNYLLEVPQFMTELYNTAENFDQGNMAKNPYHTSIVRCYLEQDTSISNYFLFNITSLDDEEMISEAEFHAFRLTDFLFPPKSVHYSVPYYLIRVYQVVDKQYLHNPDMHILLNVHYVNAQTSGWQVFNVKQAVLSWIAGNTPNLGLLVTATTPYGYPVKLRFSRRFQNDGVKQPILVLFNDIVSNTHENTVRDIQYDYTNNFQHSPIAKKSLNDNKNEQIFLMKFNDTQTPTNDTCKVYDLMINFRKLGFNNIIAPKEFNAGYCSGSCDSSNSSNIHTNYSLLMKLSKNYHTKNIENVGCAPSKFGSLAILLYTNEYNINFTQLKNMVVKKCGCF